VDAHRWFWPHSGNVSRDPQGDDKVVTTYDALGRVKQVSSPFRPSRVKRGLHYLGYDLGGRVTSVTTPDNSAVTTSYSGNTVTVTDQAGKRARASATVRAFDPGLRRSRTTTLNYLTSYSYDALANLTTVTQGSQTRTFAYDSLKRLTSATNPESGTIAYQYDANGNLTQKTDARSVHANYTYDALNRNIASPTRTIRRARPPSRGPTNRTNGKGRPAAVSSSVGTSTYSTYDALGRVTAVRKRSAVRLTR